MSGITDSINLNFWHIYNMQFPILATPVLILISGEDKTLNEMFSLYLANHLAKYFRANVSSFETEVTFVANSLIPEDVFITDEILASLKDFGMKIDKNIWCKKLLNFFEDTGSDVFIITDWEYEHEEEFFRKNTNFQIIKIKIILNKSNGKESNSNLPEDSKYYDSVINVISLEYLDELAKQFIERSFLKWTS